jgi:hypothetical protein
MVMVEAMLNAGFSNCRDEYWHYSWGDSAWAVRTGEKTCPYGWIDPPVRVESGFRGGIAGEICQLDDNTWSIRADGDGRLLVGIFWSVEKPVILRLDGLRNHELVRLSKDRKAWRAISVERDPSGAWTSVVPRYDRVFVDSAARG